MSFVYDYPRPAVTVDCLLLRINEEKIEGLFIKRKKDPFKGCWALPGGFMEIDETPEAAAVRELGEETSIKIKGVIQIGAFGAVNRDPRGRTISIAFLAFMDDEQQAKAASDAAHVEWIGLSESIDLAFDHQEILREAIKKLTDTLSIRNLGSELGMGTNAVEKLILAASNLQLEKERASNLNGE